MILITINLFWHHIDQKQKLQEIRNLIFQFQTLENELRDTFEQIETNHQNEIKRIKQQMGLKTSETNLSDNPMFNTGPLHQNPLAQQQQRGHSNSLYQTGTQSVDMYANNGQSPYANTPFRPSHGSMQPMQPRNPTGSMGTFSSPQPPPPQNPANNHHSQGNHWHNKNASATHYTQQQAQYNQQNRGYHQQS